MNVVTLIGRLTKDIEVRMTASGHKVTNFTLAVNRRAKEGEQQADFISCIAWNKTVDIFEKYTQKGSQVGIKGRIQTRNYDDQNGKRVYVTEVLVEEVQLLDSKKNNTQSDFETVNNTYSNGAGLEIDSDDLPF